MEKSCHCKMMTCTYNLLSLLYIQANYNPALLELMKAEGLSVVTVSGNEAGIYSAGQESSISVSDCPNDELLYPIMKQGYE
jgi:hypothetical protein